MSDLFTKLGIDWKLLLAQAINFGILVYILKRFVYGPVVAVLEKRRKDISDTKIKLQEADKHLQEIELEREEVLTKARKEAGEIIKKAEITAKRQSEESVMAAEEKSSAIIAEGKISLEKERSKIKSEIKNEIGSVVAAAVEKTVGDFLSKEAEEKLKAEALAIIKANAETFR